MANPNPSKNRKKGDRYEYKTRDILIENGHFVIRAGGSLGKFDFLAFKESSQLRLIQVKSTMNPKMNFTKVIEQIEQFKQPYYAQKELWIWYYRKRDPEIRMIA